MSCLPRNLKTLEEDFGELNEVSHLSEDKSATYFQKPCNFVLQGQATSEIPRNPECLQATQMSYEHLRYVMTRIGQLFGACCARPSREPNPDAASRVAAATAQTGASGVGRSMHNAPPLVPSVLNQTTRNNAQDLLQDVARIPSVFPPLVSQSYRFKGFDQNPRLFNPQLSYPLDRLIDFAKPGRCESEHRLILAECLAEVLRNPGMSHAVRFEVSAALAHVLHEGDTVNYAGATRGDSFFASMAIDLYLSDEELSGLGFVKQKFIGVLSHWVDDIAPARQEFPIQGALIQRNLMKTWIQELKNPASRLSRPTSLPSAPPIVPLNQRTHIARSMDRVMRGQEGSFQQSVHSEGVQDAGDLVLQLMTQKLERRGLQSLQDVLSEVRRITLQHSDRKNIHLGIGHICTHDAISEDTSSHKIGPALALRTLVTYISEHKDPEVAANLRDAALLQLGEIGREKPCYSGCVQRILDIPNGIDPAVSAVSIQRQIKEDVAELAVRVQNELSTFFEGTELENLERLEGVDDAVLAEIKVDLFRQLADMELGLVRGIPQNEFESEVRKLEPGFTY